MVFQKIQGRREDFEEKLQQVFQEKLGLECLIEIERARAR